MRCLQRHLPGGLAAVAVLMVAAAADEPPRPAGERPTGAAGRPADASGERDPYEIPDDTPAELLKAVERLARAPAYSVEQLQRKCRAIVAGAEKILAAEPGDDVAVEAIEWRFSALDALARSDDAQAARRLEQLVKRLVEDERPRVAAAARRYDLERRSKTLGKLSPEKQREFLDEVLTYFETADVTAGNLGILLATGMELADSGDAEVATTAYRRFALLAGRSENPQVRSLARAQFGVMLDRLNLMGQTLEVAGETLDGEKFDLAEYRGQVVLVDFWATWCGPCIQEMPNLKEHYAKYKDRGFEIVGVNVDQSRENVEAFLEQSRLPWKNLFDADPRYEDHGHPVAARYEIVALPTLLLLDREGKVVSVTAHGSRLGPWLERLLIAEDAPAAHAPAAHTPSSRR